MTDSPKPWFPGEAVSEADRRHAPATLRNRDAIGEVLRGVQAQLLDAYAVDLASGPVTPGQRARTNYARGAAATIPLFYNFQGRSEAPEEASGAGEVRITSTDAWSPWSREGTVVCYVYFGADEVTVEHDLDTWLVTEDQLAAIVDGLPGLLRAWAADPTASAAGPATPAAPAAPAGNVLRTPHGWADTGLLRGVLADVLGTGVDVEPGADGGLLVTAAAPVERLAAAHDVLTAQAAHRLDLLLPTAYRSTLGAGATWHPAERAAEPPATVLERALCEAIGEVHGAEVADVSRSYVAVGGDVERAPAVVETLARRRVLGCASVHFTSPQSLRQVAAQLEIDTRAPSASPVHLS